MKIGIVTTWFERGAAYVSRQYRNVLAHQANVYIYARPGNERLVDDHFRQAYVTFGARTDLPLASALDLDDFKQWIAARQLDILLFNEQHWWPPVLAASQLGVITGAYVDYYTDETVRLFDNYDFLVCNTRRHHSAFEWHPQALYVPWGTETDLFKPASDDPVGKDGEIVFFHSCGFSPYRKGTDLMLHAFDKVQGRARLVIHSQAKLKERVPDAAPVIERLVASGRLAVVEETVGAPGLYHLGDVYVYPSRLEGIGLTMAEALACGLPLITSDEPPMNEFSGVPCCRRVAIAKRFKRKDNYFWPMCEVAVDALADAMQHYVDHADRCRQYKRAARKHAENHFDWTSNASDLPELFRTVTKRQVPETARQMAMAYEAQRSSLGIRLYRLAPLLFNLLRAIKRR